MKEFRKMPLDRDYRDNIIKLLDKAEREVLVVTGEFHGFETYQDLKWAVKAAIDRGVSFKVINSSAPQSVINKLLVWGSEVYVTSQEDVPEDHYMIVDKKQVMISESHVPNKIGVREGRIEDDSDEVKRKVEEWENLSKKSSKVTSPDWDEDVMNELINDPADLGFSAEEFFRKKKPVI